MYILSILLFSLIFSLNHTKQLLVCSFLFVSSTFIANTITELYSRKKAINILSLCILTSIILLWNTLDFMLILSFAGVFVSISVSMMFLGSSKNLYFRNFISLTLATLIDSSIVALGLLSKFPFSKVITIGIKDCIFKLSYISLIGLCMFLVLQWLLRRKKHLQKIC